VTFGNIGPAADPTSSAYAAAAAFTTFESSFSKGFTLSQIQAALGKIAFGAPSFTQPAADFIPPKVTEWSLAIEHPLNARNILSVTYSGNHGFNEPVTNGTLDNFLQNPAKFPAGYLDLPLASPDPRFTSVSQGTLIGYSNYNGLSVQLRHAYSYGLVGQIGYTWSHGLSLGSIYDPRNLNMGYSNTGIDNRHKLTSDLLWTMPKLKGNLLEKALGGWTVGGKFFVYSGRPFSVTDSQIASQVGTNFSATYLADLTDFSAEYKNCGRNSVNVPCLSQSQFVVSTTANPSLQTNYGNTPPNAFYSPGYFDIDGQITKAIRFKERLKLEIGASALNVMNHANFSTPSGTVTSTAVGKISGTVSQPVSIYGSGQGAIVSGRVIVVTAKFSF
jgi:hypothetical protein